MGRREPRVDTLYSHFSSSAPSLLSRSQCTESLLTVKLCEDCDQDLILQHRDPDMIEAALGSSEQGMSLLSLRLPDWPSD